MALIGAVIDGKYEILKQIGKGGMSKVYLAMDNRLNKQWAVKEIQKQVRDKNNEVMVQSLIAEANLMKKLDHPALPRIVDIIDYGDTIYVIMDYIEGETLASVLEEYGAQPQETVIEWAKELGGVLDYLHTRKPPIIYRDMKPANVMVSPEGNIKLIDFGIAREYKEQRLEDTVSLGTRGYAAPEQFGGMGQTDARTDVYCLGVTLYHLLTGQNPCEPPYELYPIRYWNPALSGGLEKIIITCTQKNPDDRYQSCAELLYALDHYEEADDAYRAGQKRKVRLFSLTAALTLVCLLTGIWGQMMKQHTNNSNYEALLSQAQRAVSPEAAAADCLQAVSVKPENTAAYLDLIDCYKSDAVFTVEEQEQLVKALNTNLEALREQEDYVRLAFEVGKLYWYYYDYGKSGSQDDNRITRMKSAVQWFQDVIDLGSEDFEYYDMARVYHDIGVFNRDITLNVEEASDKGMYKPYFDNLKELLTMAGNGEEENEIVILELYRLTMYSLETYARKLKADGVGQKEVGQVYEEVRKGTEGIAPTTDKTREMKEYITARAELAAQAIQNAYQL